MTLRELRERKGLTQEALADRADCDQTTISLLEKGRVSDPRWSTLEKLAGVLGTSERQVMAAIRNSVAA